MEATDTLATTLTMDTRRGCWVCSACSVSNGNRASVCKGCGVAKGTRGVQRKRKVKHSSDVTELLHDAVTPRPKRAFSVRLREAGPDYRSIVTEDVSSVNAMPKVVQLPTKEDFGLPVIATACLDVNTFNLLRLRRQC